MDDIKTEKRLELFNECVRYQDLVRWGDGEKMLGNQGNQIASFTVAGVTYPYSNDGSGFKAKHNLLPIPRKEMELNKSMVQNQGWD